MADISAKQLAAALDPQVFDLLTLVMSPEWERRNTRPGRIPVEMQGGGGVRLNNSPPKAANDRPAPKAANDERSNDPYRNVPDQLMGFRREGPNKGFEDEKYRHIQSFEITDPVGGTWYDAIKGLNPSHALGRAYRNWPDATFRPLTPEEAARLAPDLFK